MFLLYGYLIVINLISVIACCYDKFAAVNGKWRISEKSLLGLSAFGGAVAMYITMKIIRHKTKHAKFMVGLPIIIIVHAVIVFTVLKKI